DVQAAIRFIRNVWGSGSSTKRVFIRNLTAWGESAGAMLVDAAALLPAPMADNNDLTSANTSQGGVSQSAHVPGGSFAYDGSNSTNECALNTSFDSRPNYVVSAFAPNLNVLGFGVGASISGMITAAYGNGAHNSLTWPASPTGCTTTDQVTVFPPTMLV